MAPPLLLLRDIHLTFGGMPLLEGAELSVSAGERICLVGRNGSGKSTLMKIATGEIEADSGERFLQPGTTLRYLPQEPDVSGYKTVSEYVRAGLEAGDNPKFATMLIDRLELSDIGDPVSLSGGEVRRAALARAIAPQPDILLLDEPTNHLDLPIIDWLEKELIAIRSALVLISHDRRFLENLSRTTLWINQGRIHRIKQGFSNFEPWREKFLKTEALERHKLNRKITAETEWLHKGVTARRKRNMGRLRALLDLRAKRRSDRGTTGVVNMLASEADISGKRVCIAKEISKSYGDRVVVDNFSTLIARGDRVGIVGPNGAGKTTLLRLLVGEIEPDTGHVRLGKNLELENLDQQRETLDPTDTLARALTGGSDKISINGEVRHVIGYMKDFLFTPNQARTPIAVMSGGERGRIMLARAFAKPSNLLILDEPTNDLDLETLDLLQELLAEYQGTVLLVSHDRDFLDRVVTSVIASEGDGKWKEYAGGYSDMLAQRKRGRDIMQPKETQRPKKQVGSVVGSQPPKTHRKKLTFNDQHLLETLPSRIEKLQADIATHRDALADPDLFSTDPEKFKTTAKALKQTEADLLSAEDKWLELEIKRETLELG